MCPTNRVFRSIQIRVGTAAECNLLRTQPPAERGVHEVVAVEDGTIQNIGSYSVQLRGLSGRVYTYMHLNMRRLGVSVGDTVEAGQFIGYMSNDFGGTPTTFHLRFEIQAPIEGEGIIHVPPYMSLVRAYERREGITGTRVRDEEVSTAP